MLHQLYDGMIEAVVYETGDRGFCFAKTGSGMTIHIPLNAYRGPLVGSVDPEDESKGFEVKFTDDPASGLNILDIEPWPGEKIVVRVRRSTKGLTAQRWLFPYQWEQAANEANQRIDELINRERQQHDAFAAIRVVEETKQKEREEKHNADLLKATSEAVKAMRLNPRTIDDAFRTGWEIKKENGRQVILTATIDDKECTITRYRWKPRTATKRQRREFAVA